MATKRVLLVYEHSHACEWFKLIGEKKKEFRYITANLRLVITQNFLKNTTSTKIKEMANAIDEERR